MATVNEEYFNALVRHQIYLQRSSEDIRKKILKLLEKTEEELKDKITAKLLDHTGISPSLLKKLTKLQEEIKLLRSKAWDDIDQVWLDELTILTKQEPEIIAGITQTVSPVILELQLPALSSLQEIVKSSPFEGKTLKEWSKAVRQADLNRISDQIKIGIVQGEPSAVIAKRVVGISELTKTNADAITRTAVNHLSHQARKAFYKQNSDIISEEVFVATLDSRTTAICRSLDGKKYSLDEGPQPPLHFRCRSLRVAVIDGEVLGVRPAKPTTERIALKQFTEKNNLKSINSRDDLPRGYKTQFDKFLSSYVRSTTGQIPAKINYGQWLKGQSVDFQNEVLGKTKATLFRKGGLTLDKFVYRNGTELNLADLASKHKEAFSKAGLDPEDYL